MKSFIFLLLLASGAGWAASSGVKVLNDDAHYPEGPVWFQGKLYYVEYDRNTIDVWDGKGNQYFATMPGCGPSAVVNTKGGEFLVTCYDDHTVGHLAALDRRLTK